MNAPMSTHVPKLYERAFALIAQDIRNGILPLGDRLTEIGLAYKLGISRAPIRQALRMLEEHNYVRRSNSGGFEVSSPGSHTLGNLKGLSAVKDLRSVKRASWENIYNEVEQAIVSRTPFGSWHVNEVALAKHYEVSRTISRDVLARLQQKGILTKDEKGRWFVPLLASERVAEFYELRAILEPVALEQAYLNAPKAKIALFRDRLLAVMDGDKATDYPSKLDALEKDLHVSLLAFCNNTTLLNAIRLPQSMLLTHHFLYDWTNDMYDSEPFLPEHLNVFELLLDDKVAQASAALSEHLKVSNERSMERICNAIKKIELDDLVYLNRQSGKVMS